MTEESADDQPDIPLRRRRRGRLGVWPILSALLLASFVGLTLMSASGVPLRLPSFVADIIEKKINESLPGGGVRLGRVEVLVGPQGRPRVQFRDVELTDGGGNSVALLNEAGVSLTSAALARGRIEPAVLRLSGAQITVRRSVTGQFALSFGGTGPEAAQGTLASVIDSIDALFTTGPMATILRIEASDLTITLEDARSGRVWQATDGTLTLVNQPGGVEITVFTEVFNGTETLARTQLSFRSVKGTRRASLGVSFDDAAAGDIALQSPALAALALLEAPISGSMRATVADDGVFDGLAATLRIGQGAFRPGPQAQRFGFAQARVYLDYDPRTGRIDLPEIFAETERVNLVASGHAYLTDLVNGWPGGLVAQARIKEMAVAPGEVFDRPLDFRSGAADVKVRLQPFGLTVGQFTLGTGSGDLRGRGSVDLTAGGWQVALDADADPMPPAEMLSLWPVALAPNTRRWVKENVSGGLITEARAAVRIEPGQKPRPALQFRFADAETRVLRNLPTITGGSGRASLFDNRFSLLLDTGTMAPPGSRPANLAGSTFLVPDNRIRPAPAEIRITADAPLATVLLLLNNPPFRVLQKATRPDDLLATKAQAGFEADVRLRLDRRITAADVDYTVAGKLRDVEAEALVPGRRLTADEVSLAVTPRLMTVSGPVALDGIPFDAAWTRAMGPEADGASYVAARADLTDAALRSFGVNLPQGAVSGAAVGDIAVTLSPGAPAAFRLHSDLVGAQISAPQIGWSKPAGTQGALEAQGTIGGGQTAISRLELSAPGLSAGGSVAPGEGPGLATLKFDRVQVGAWLDAPVTITGRGPGRPAAVAVTGGRVDLRRLPRLGGGGGGGGPLSLSLDTLQVTEGIALSPFRADLVPGPGLRGEFTAQVNGRTPVRGVLEPSGGRTAVRVLSDNGGGVLSDAGIFPNARDGAFDLRLVPKGGAGQYDGALSIQNVRLRNAPILAGLLDAISVVGMIDQLQGPGIVFTTVDSRFEVSPERIVVREGSAVGASLGISLDGVYEIAAKRFDMQGVISPIYLLNGIGQIFTRRGEGLFGFSFKLTGVAGAPEVRVNPLSILTPGMFREIFRTAPPAPAE